MDLGARADMCARRKSRSGENVTFCGGKRESFLKSESGCQKCVGVKLCCTPPQAWCSLLFECGEKRFVAVCSSFAGIRAKKRKTNLKAKLRVVASGKSKFLPPFFKFLQ